MKTKTMYMHTLDGKPANYDPDHHYLYFAGCRHPVRLVPTLKQIRHEQSQCDVSGEYGYVLVKGAHQMTDLQTPLRVEYDNDVTPGDDGIWEFFRIIDAADYSLATFDSKEIAVEIVRRCNEFEGLRKLLACCLDEWYYEIHVPTEEAIQTKEAVVAALKGTSNE